MRRNLYLSNTTKQERIVHEVLKELRIPFKHRWLVNGREVDFIIGALALEIDGHEQDTEKNNMLLLSGYTPVHLHNSEVTRENIKQLLQNYNGYY
jgi:very-short-patch-repair endonuclease